MSYCELLAKPDMDPLLCDITDDEPTASDDGEQPNDLEYSPSLQPSPASDPEMPPSTAWRHLPKRPRPRAYRQRKVVKMKANPTTSGSLLTELKKTNTTMLALAEKVKMAEKRMRNMEKK